MFCLISLKKEVWLVYFKMDTSSILDIVIMALFISTDTNVSHTEKLLFFCGFGN